MKFLSISAALTVFAVAGCASPRATVSQISQFKIADVQASMAPGVNARTDIASKISYEGRAKAAQYNGGNVSAQSARIVEVVVNSVHYKSAAASLLIGGSGNVISGTTYVIQPTGERGSPIPVEYRDTVSYGANGILGLAVAAAATTDSGSERVDTRLAKGLAGAAIEAAYTQQSPRQIGVSPIKSLSYQVGPDGQRVSNAQPAYDGAQPLTNERYTVSNSDDINDMENYTAVHTDEQKERLTRAGVVYGDSNLPPVAY